MELIDWCPQACVWGPRVGGSRVGGSRVWDPHVAGVCVVHGWSVAAHSLAGGQGQEVAAGSSDGSGLMMRME